MARSSAAIRKAGVVCGALSVGALAAMATHAGLFALAATLPVPRTRPVSQVTEVTLAPEPVAEVMPAQPLPARTDFPAAAPAAPVRRVAPRPEKAETQPPAAAGDLLTALSDAPAADEPVRFAVDPNGESFGFGVVARGGSASGREGGTGAAVAPPAPLNRALYRTNFAVPPRLDLVDPCRGLFPSAADADQGDVFLSIEVAASGVVQRAVVERELPAGQGFGHAALACLRDKRFTPARDESGLAIAARAPVALPVSKVRGP